ncbi:MAG: AbgT family transporter [Eubacteriales bacterium]|nr:AbgT family transporter [Eubacteriales bacterium]
MNNTKSKKQHSKLAFPHVMVLLVLLALFSCLLTYIIPAGTYQFDDNGYVIADSFSYVQNTPVSPLAAVIKLTSSIASMGTTYALLFILGGMVSVMISSGSVENIVDFSIFRLQDKSLKVLIPCITVLMSILGGLAGNDAMITFVACGMLLARRTNLDRLSGMAIFYLPYITGQAIGPTVLMILMCQEMAGIPAVSGLSVRIFIWIIFTAFCAFYNTRYALRISRDPSRSIDGEILTLSEEEKNNIGNETALKPSSVVAVVMMILPFVIYAYGSSKYGWGFDYLIALGFVSAIILGFVFRYTPNDWAKRFCAGAAQMGPVCLLIGFSKLISVILADGQVINTIAHSALLIIQQLGSSFSAIGMFLFTTLFNLMMPSGPAKVPILMPLFTPVADILGITRQILCTCYQLGDGLTNFLTPVSSVLATGLILSETRYSKWLRYAVPYALVLVAFSAVCIFVLQGIGWTGI